MDASAKSKGRHGEGGWGADPVQPLSRAVAKVVAQGGRRTEGTTQHTTPSSRTNSVATVGTRQTSCRTCTSISPPAASACSCCAISAHRRLPTRITSPELQPASKPRDRPGLTTSRQLRAPPPSTPHELCPATHFDGGKGREEAKEAWTVGLSAPVRLVGAAQERDEIRLF